MIRRAVLIVVLAVACCASMVEPVTAAQVTTQLIAEVAAIRAGEPFWIALHQRIAPGWHTYWRNPGDSGEPVSLAWTLPPGFVADEIAWPVPERLPVGPVMSSPGRERSIPRVRTTTGSRAPRC